eukprot:TRINITY_DN24214_c0_g1_i1.p1 TRINITY_DN24214_c0_g1~~TRINITY_DN24214_c0_g1_i1.p1  ORF type:complete len:501 (+),score=102.58 TRINITY_DN24214_c0_g1_i1:105-1607(+)
MACGEEMATVVPGADGSDADGRAGSATRLLVLTLNEGLQTVAPEMRRRAVAAALADRPQVVAVAVARQESLPGSCWSGVMSTCGFDKRLASVNSDNSNVLEIYTRSGPDGENFRVLDTFVQAASDTRRKGCAVAVLEQGPLRICLGGLHLDGNLPCDRIAHLPAAMKRAWSRAGRAGIDVALFAGDVNFTINPEEATASSDGRGSGGSADADARACAGLVAADAAILQARAATNGLLELSPATRAALEAQLSTPAARASLCRLFDGCPASLPILETGRDAENPSSSADCSKEGLRSRTWTEGEAGSEPESAASSCDIQRLELQSMPPGSLPTYRFSRGASGCLSSGAGGDGEEEGLRRLSPDLELPVSSVRDCYFADEKAGVLKKRGNMVRLNLGWLDRLYCGVREAFQSAGGLIDIVQGDPLLLHTVDGECLDHAFVSWVVTIVPPRARGASDVHSQEAPAVALFRESHREGFCEVGRREWATPAPRDRMAAADASVAV